MNGSTKTWRGVSLHASIGINTRDRSEIMYCGLRIAYDNIIRDWRAPNCKRCLIRLAKDK